MSRFEIHDSPSESEEPTRPTDDVRQNMCTASPQHEQQVVAADRFISLNELAASLAHELNNPLGIIVGFAETLLAKVEPAHPHAEPLRIIAEEGRRCSNFVTDLLAFGGPSERHVIPTDLGVAVRTSLERMADSVQQHQIKLVLKISTHAPLVMADPQQVEQVLQNVFANALEAMPGGGRLTVRLTTRTQARSKQTSPAAVAPRSVLIKVSDTGSGMDNAALQKIFRPLFTSKTKKGMGLGLSICQALMQANAGTITIHSTPGQGTTVSLSFPVEEEAQ
jgi:signal transduction histidine kinase